MVIENNIPKSNAPVKPIKNALEKDAPPKGAGAPGGETITENVGRTLPKELVPSGNVGYILGAIFVIVIIIGALQFPFSSMLSGNANVEIKIGIPWPFLVFNLADASELPLKWWGLIFDLIIYSLIAYAIDISWTLFRRSSVLADKKVKRIKKPKVIKDSIADKVTKKVLKIN
jgi:hypothetical protein